jgi:hypothetical protein
MLVICCLHFLPMPTDLQFSFVPLWASYKVRFSGHFNLLTRCRDPIPDLPAIEARVICVDFDSAYVAIGSA